MDGWTWIGARGDRAQKAMQDGHAWQDLPLEVFPVMAELAGTLDEEIKMRRFRKKSRSGS